MSIIEGDNSGKDLYSKIQVFPEKNKFYEMSLKLLNTILSDSLLKIHTVLNQILVMFGCQKSVRTHDRYQF
jgi:hypothetical protein